MTANSEITEEAPFQQPRIIAWEVTRRCPLKCRHCRAAANAGAHEGELSTEECRRVIDSLSGMMIIWTGGEPMSRPDIVELVAYATSRGLRSVMAPCGMLVTDERLAALKSACVMALSFSLDGPDADTHDSFRGVDGAYDSVTRAMASARRVGIPFQINTTVSKLNINKLDAIADKARELGAAKLDLFFLVPIGRGRGIAQYALSDDETRRVLDWSFALEGIAVKHTCCPSAPAYWASCGAQGPRPCGCLGGRGFAFLSHVGDLQTCGFIDVPCGNIRDFGYDFPALIAAAVNPLGEHGSCRGLICGSI